MKKIFCGLLTVTLAFVFCAGSAGCAHHYSNGEKYGKHSASGKRYGYSRSYKNDNKLLKKIQKNERLISSLEREIDRLFEPRSHHNSLGHHKYSHKLRYLQKEIRRLERRNRCIRRKIRR